MPRRFEPQGYHSWTPSCWEHMRMPEYLPWMNVTNIFLIAWHPLWHNGNRPGFVLWQVSHFSSWRHIQHRHYLDNSHCFPEPVSVEVATYSPQSAVTLCNLYIQIFVPPLRAQASLHSLHSELPLTLTFPQEPHHELGASRSPRPSHALFASLGVCHTSWTRPALASPSLHFLHHSSRVFLSAVWAPVLLLQCHCSWLSLLTPSLVVFQITHNRVASNPRNVLSPGSGGRKSEVQVSAGLWGGVGSGPLSWLLGAASNP